MANGLRQRENVAGMDSSHPMLRSYADAVQAMKDLPESDPRNWKRQAEIHRGLTGDQDPSGCPHGNWYFLPWHRAYVLEFEEICRDLSGNPDFALPYWNWTQNNSIPGPFRQGTLLDDTRIRDSVPARFVEQPIIDGILSQGDFEFFASFRPFGQNDTDPRWQRAGGAASRLEGTPHDFVHGAIGSPPPNTGIPTGNMGDVPTAALDPIFWLHHCNIDRLWAEWNAQGHRNTSDARWIDFRLTPFDRVVGDLQDITQLGYTYDTIAQPLLPEPSPLPPLLDRAKERFELMEPRVVTLGSEASFPVETPQSALPLAAEAVSAGDVAAEGGTKVFAFVRGVEPPQDPGVTVNVFLNCPYLSADTPVSDPHYVGNFTFFGFHGGNGHDHGSHGHDTKSFAFDLTETVDRLRSQESDLEERLTVQLLPVPYEGYEERDVPPEEIKIGGVEIVYT
jgi:tyrosinase